MRLTAVVGMVALLATGCSDEPEAPENEDIPTFAMGASFEDGAMIPADNTCTGSDTPPSVSWDPMDVDAYVVSMTDQDAEGFVHWVVFGIPGDVSELPPGELPVGSGEGANDFGSIGYRGPCPPPGDGPHTYELTVYGVDGRQTVDLAPGVSLDDVLDAIECCVVGTATMTGEFNR